MNVSLALFSYGGVYEGTVDCILGELHYASTNKINVTYHRISGDALISRSRSRALGKFMESKDLDVMVMIDHDISWRPGDAVHVAEQALKENALVGGLYCKRAFHKGWASRVGAGQEVKFGQPGLLPTPALATGFMAIPRTIVTGIDERLDITSDSFQKELQEAFDKKDVGKVLQLQDLSVAPIADGAYREIDFRYKDYFRCIRAPSGNPKVWQFLSEDWSFAVRADFCGFKSHISTFPVLEHTGDYRYKICDGMDNRDKGIADGNDKKDSNDRGPDRQDKESGRDKSDLRNRLSARCGNKPVSAKSLRKASRRRGV